MKKLISVLLALSMLLFAFSAFAEDVTAQETPPEPPEGFNGSMPPEPPEGFDGSTPPEPPEGFNGSMPPEPPEGFDGSTPPGGFGGGQPGNPPGGRASSFEYSAAANITSAAETAGQSYSSETADESALIVNTKDNVRQPQHLSFLINRSEKHMSGICI